MNSKDLFEKFYEKNNIISSTNSLVTFFEENVRHRLNLKDIKILELGSGSFSVFEDIVNIEGEIVAIDFSKQAIAKAPISKIDYREADITNSSFFDSSKYDLVFDSHCINCITLEAERALAFNNIYGTLKDSGIFASELMIRPTRSSISMPFKSVKSAIELEEELISHGFKIVYFMISNETNFTCMVEGQEVECDLLKVIALK